MPSSRRDDRDRDRDRQRRRRTHHRTDSNGELLGKSTYEDDNEGGSPSKQRPKKSRGGDRRSHTRGESESGGSRLSTAHLAQLDRLNDKNGWKEYDRVVPKARAREEAEAELEERERRRREHKRRKREEERRAAERGVELEEEVTYVKEKRARRKSGGRVVSGQRLERGSRSYYGEKEEFRDDVRRRDGGSEDEEDEGTKRRKRRRNILIAVGVTAVILIVAIAVGVVLSKKNSGGGGGGSGGSSGSGGSKSPSNGNLDGISEDDIPKQYQGTNLDPFSWYDTNDFNVTFTTATVGNLSIMGLNTTWDDTKSANDKVPALKDDWNYGTDLIHGVNLGGWLSIEPFITPSLFSQYTTHDNVVDEYTLCSKLGPMKCKSTLEEHYSSFVTEQTFKDIQDAGFDHVRIPFSYWAVKTFDGDPYLPLVSWRYLLRGIEWARKCGLRINLDLHGAPGSQNGWNHSGRQGAIGWLNGTDGDLNAQRTIDIHDQLSKFFTQPRYKNIITMYGLLNEPRMVELDTQAVTDWTSKASSTVQGNGFKGIIVFGDGFMGLDNWQGKLQGVDNLLLDVHQYVIFNTGQIVLNHHDKINFACGGWTAQIVRSEDTDTGFGPTLCGEWSQADTDCAQYLNNVGVGSRWEGTLNMVNTPGGSLNGSVLDPTCPTDNSPRCSCQQANADPSDYSDTYKQWLLMFAEAQMHSFEKGWGWFYWTWQTESSPQWSYKAGLAAGIMPKLAYERDFDCSQDIPDFANLGLDESY